MFQKYFVVHKRSAVKNYFSTYIWSKVDSCFCEFLHAVQITRKYPKITCKSFFFIQGFVRFSLLKDHIQSMHERTKNYVCKICGEAYAHRAAIAYHMQSKHNDGKKDFKCDQCHFETNTKANLTTHKKRAHTERTEIFPCPQEDCAATFTSKSSLKHHKYTHQTIVEKDPEKFPYPCDYCGTRFIGLKGKIAHEKRAHLERKAIQCPNCDMTLISIQALAVHLRTRHPECDKFFCKFCDAKFYGQKVLDIHVKKEHTEQSNEFDRPKTRVRKPKRKTETKDAKKVKKKF